MSVPSVTTAHVPGRPRLAYDYCGTGPTVVFLHGIGGNRSNWTEQLACLAPRYTAVAWDARGYGLSEDYAEALKFPDFSVDLNRLLDHLGVASAHLVGLSMGGRIALDFHEQNPARVASLVLCDAFPGFDESFTRAQREEFIRLRKAPLLAGKEPRDIAPVVAKTLVSPMASAAIMQRLIDSMSLLHKESYIKTIEAMTFYERIADLGRIHAPTQIIVGEYDTLTPPALARRMASQIPDARLAVLRYAGHLSNIEQPGWFNAVLLDFLDTLQA